LSPLALLFCVAQTGANSPDRAFCEKILGENKHFIDFVNSGISNFAEAEHLKIFQGRSA
jgi:hypothetical protein